MSLRRHRRRVHRGSSSMCGIAGIYKPGGLGGTRRAAPADDRPAAAPRARRRGRSGSTRAAGVGARHRRLSIIDLSPAGHQPMASRDGRYVDRLQRRDLQLPRHPRRARAPRASRSAGTPTPRCCSRRSSAGALEAALERARRHVRVRALGPARARALHLARDRLGEKPLYYGWHRRPLAVRLRAQGAARATPASRPTIDRDALAPILRHSYVPAPRSHLRGIHKLPPAHDPDGRGPASPEPARVGVLVGARGRLEAGARRPVRRDRRGGRRARSTRCCATPSALRMIADVPLGAFLSGGIDSSTVVALMQAQSAPAGADLHIGFTRAGLRRGGARRAVAAHLGTDHTELYVEPRRGARRRSRGCRRCTTSRSPTRRRSRPSSSSQLARRHVTVACRRRRRRAVRRLQPLLLGRRGCGARSARCRGRLRRRVAAAMRGAVAGGLGRGARRWRRSLPARLRRPRPATSCTSSADVLGADDAGRRSTRAWSSHWAEPGAVVGAAREPRALLERRRAPWPRLAGFVAAHDVPRLRRPTCRTTSWSRSTGRAWRSSLEARVPLLDHRVVEFAWRAAARA